MLLIRNYLYKFFLLYTTQMHKKLSHREQIACQRYEWQDGRHNTQTTLPDAENISGVHILEINLSNSNTDDDAYLGD